jgi:glycosyltransferase involved in cell wall biosynthesis
MSRYCTTMHIVHVVPSMDRPWSGTLTVIVHLASALSRLGHDVEVWHRADWNHSDFEAHVKLLADAGTERVAFGSFGELRRAAAHATTGHSGAGVDLIHLHGAFNPTNTIIARALQAPYVFSPHSGYDPISLRRSSAKKSAFGVLFERPMIRRAAMVVALTEQERDQVITYCETPRCVVIPNGVSGPPQVDDTVFRKSIGLDSRDHLAIYVGRLDVERKGLDLLMLGIERAPSWHLALVGPDERDGLRRIRAEIASRRLGRRVHVFPPRFGLELHEALAASDVFTLLSRWEGMPMSLIEALSHGKPAVVGPAVERCLPVKKSGAGWVASSPHEIGRMLETFASLDASGREGMARAAEDLAARFEWPTIARRYEEAYASITVS